MRAARCGAVAVATSALLLLGGCGGSGKRRGPSSRTPVLTRAQAAQRYEMDIAPANEAFITFFATALSTWSDSTSYRQAARDAAPVAAALKGMTPQLASLASVYPPAAFDIRNMLSAFSPVVGDLAWLRTINDSDAWQWLQQFSADFKRIRSEAKIVRSDLGLPPPVRPGDRLE
jgi:hypothetical protein